MGKASKIERYMLNLINNSRDNAGLRDLRFDRDLNSAADNHSEWMLRADRFSHTGTGSSSATERMRDEGYRFAGSWKSGENIGYVSIDNNGTLRDEVRDLHNRLMNSPSHRENLLSGGFKDIGIGLEVGQIRHTDGRYYKVLMVTQDFARSSADNSAPPPDRQALAADAFDFRPAAREQGTGETTLSSTALRSVAAPLADDTGPDLIVMANSHWDGLL